MDIEYEATFTNINKDEMRARLKKADAVLIYPEFLQKRIVFNLPAGHEVKGGWLRVREEQGSKVTMSLKVVDGGRIEDQKEICLQVDNFSKAENFLSHIGCERKAYQESKREKWELDGAEVTLDEWPFLEPFIEIEAGSEEKVKQASSLLGLDYQQALFCSIDTLYSLKYSLSLEVINNKTPEIIFGSNNPFVR
jgi:adenylate cyclase class 2